MKIQVAEIFDSISGEVGGFEQGSPTTFIRLTGCNLNCPFCDTAWANQPNAGTELEIRDLADLAFKFPWKQILITGGEPLLQKDAVQALVNLIKYSSTGYKIQIETNGTIPFDDIAMVNYWVADYKGQDAMNGEEYKFNPGYYSDHVWIKYLVGSQEDLARAVDYFEGPVSLIQKRPHFAVSILSTSGLELSDVVDTILRASVPITLNVQLHKKVGAR